MTDKVETQQITTDNSNTNETLLNDNEKTIEEPISSPSSPSGSVTQRICKFYQSGTCRNGDKCRFFHGQSNGSPGLGTPLPPPPPHVIINIPQGQPIFSIDVECVASGVQHNARSIAQVALVDEWNRPIFNVLIKQDVPVASYITELTGLTKELLDAHGLPLAEALALLRAYLSPDAILVGQNILKDVQWLQLAEGIDYRQLIDLSALLRVWNVGRGEYTTFSQDHCAKVWLGIGEREHHNAVEDAMISMSLFNTYRFVQWDANRLYQLQQATLAAPKIPGFSAKHPVIDGCCMGNRKLCSCGAAFL
jgi:RNA exonuclease 4